MVVLTREQLGLDTPDTAGEGNGHHTSNDRDGHVTFSRPVTIQERVYTAVLASAGAVTRREIATALGLKSTPWLIGVIDGLVADGYLTRTHHTWKNGVLMYRYEVNR